MTLHPVYSEQNILYLFMVCGSDYIVTLLCRGEKLQGCFITIVDMEEAERIMYGQQKEYSVLSIALTLH